MDRISRLRPDWDTYFMMIAEVAATRSSCLRRQVGAVIVKDSQLISSGYNGAPKKVGHCLDVGCMRQALGIPSGQRHEMCRGSHAEINAIAQAASVGIPTLGATIYCTHSPCTFCTKAIINAGITRIVYGNPYPDELAEKLRGEARMQEVVFSGEDKEEMLRWFDVIHKRVLDSK